MKKTIIKTPTQNMNKIYYRTIDNSLYKINQCMHHKDTGKL